jgi:predicted transcriptional regulator
MRFAAKVRGARAVLGWSQTQLAKKVGITQPTIHRVEQGSGDLKRSTALAIEEVLAKAGIAFEPFEGGFKIVVPDQRRTK